MGTHNNYIKIVHSTKHSKQGSLTNREKEYEGKLKWI